MEEITDYAMEELQESLPLEGDSLKRKREETDKETSTDELQEPVEGAPAVAKPRLESAEPVEGAGQTDDSVMGGEGVGEKPESLESKVDDGDEEHVAADGKEKEEQVNAGGVDEGMKLHQEADDEVAKDSGKTTGGEDAEENGGVEPSRQDQEDKLKENCEETENGQPGEVGSSDAKEACAKGGEPMEFGVFEERNECEESMDIEKSKERKDEDNKFKTENSTKQHVGEPGKAEAEKLTEAEGSREDQVSQDKVEIEKNMTDAEEPDKVDVSEVGQLDTQEEQEVPERKREVEESLKEENTEDDKSIQVEPSVGEEVPEIKAEVEKCTNEETGEPCEVEVQKAETETNNNRKEEIGGLGKAEGNEVTQAVRAQDTEVPQGKVETSMKGDGRKRTEADTEEPTQTQGSPELVSGDKSQTEKSREEDAEELSDRVADEISEPEYWQENVPKNTVDIDKSTKVSGESDLAEAVKSTESESSEEKGPREDTAGNETSWEQDTGKLPLAEADNPMVGEGVQADETDRNEEPIAAEDSEKTKNVESKVETSTKQDIDQTNERIHSEEPLMVQDSKDEFKDTQVPMEVEESGEKENAITESENNEFDHSREMEEDAKEVTNVEEGTEYVTSEPMEVEHSRKTEEDTKEVANIEKVKEEDDCKEVKNIEKGREEDSNEVANVADGKEEEDAEDIVNVEKGLEDGSAATNELEHSKEKVLDNIEEVAVAKIAEAVTAGPDKESDLRLPSASTAEQGIAVKSGEEKGEEEEALESRREEAEEKEATNESSDEKSETGTDRDVLSSPTPVRRKRGRKSVASKAAQKQKDPQKPPRNPERVELLKKMATLEDMKKLLAEHGRSEKDYKIGNIIEVDDLMQTDYEYKLEAAVGKDFAEGFVPHFTPKEMLELGVFEGKVINDCIFEFPKEWYEGAVEKEKLCPQGPEDSVNQFKVKSRLPSKEWRKKGWIPRKDPHGWFQWYCRYYLGRRLEPDDTYQMSRWRQMRRHAGQIKKYCEPGDLSCRAKQRQTLLNWSHDCFM